jgi:AcrR family transcriptional regulator
MAKSAAPAERASVRERLLASASQLFYEEGVNTVGVDRILEHSGVAKASMYKHFGSKEELIRAYLEARHERTRERMTTELAARYSTARERLLGVFEVQGMAFSEPHFRGCAFVSANAEAKPGSSAEAATKDYREWVWSLFLDLAKEAGAKDPESLAQQLVILYDGGGISAWMDHNPAVAKATAEIARSLIDAAVPKPRGRRALRSS